MLPKEVYLDYVTTTPLNIEVQQTYQELLSKYFANSSSLYALGREVARLENQARQQVLKLLELNNHEVIFTSGASEANSLAIKGIALKYLNQDVHFITSTIEHASVLNAFKQLEELFNFKVTYLPVNEEGVISVNDLSLALRDNTVLVSIQAINNEIGSIQPISEIAKVLKPRHQVVFHVDGVQALGKHPLDLTDVDLVTFSAHKIYGLKGSGVLIKRAQLELVPLINGGSQEYGYRGGTSNSLVSAMFAKTLRLALEKQDQNLKHVSELNSYLKERLSTLPQVELISSANASPYLLSMHCSGISSEVLMNALDKRGIYISAKSTCSNKTLEDSPVLAALNLSSATIKEVVRVSLSHLTTKEEIDYFYDSLKEIIDLYAL